MNNNSVPFVPVAQKALLTIQEASEYFNIGENKLRTMADSIPGISLSKGTHRLIKRERMEKILLEAESI